MEMSWLPPLTYSDCTTVTQVDVEAEVAGDSSLEHEFESAKAKVQPSLSSLFEDEEVVEVDAGVQDETLLVSDNLYVSLALLFIV